MLVNMKCPSCGATMQFDDSMDSMNCPYCGSSVANVAQKVDITQNVNVSGTVVHVQDRSNEPNLYISYNTNNPSVGLVYRIVTTGAKGTCVNGQTLSYHLNQGPHTIVLKIGKKNYDRNIVIPPDNQPVRIYASFNGRGQITVDQPNVTATSGSSGSGQANQVKMNAPKAPGKPKSPLSILAFILSLTMYLSWAGAGLGAVETFVLDKPKEKNHIFSYLAMGIGAFLTICLIVGLAGGSKTKTSDVTVTSAVVETTTIEETKATTTAATAAETQSTTVEETYETDEDTEDDEDEEAVDDNDGQVDPELKAFLDSYEAFYDEYIEFYVKYAESPNDLTLMAQYANMMLKYNEFAEAAEKYDTEEMSEVDRLYYIEVTTRVSQKLLEATASISD